PSTTIQFHVPRTSHVTIKIFNILGREIKTLLDTEIQAGQHKMLWNGKDEQNRQVTSGVYFYQMKAGDFQMTRKMILLY
ncbi:MAG: FlgD immunoglobulin-like domain containing protein, partial [Candidatus Hodarchaeota archaeon]